MQTLHTTKIKLCIKANKDHVPSSVKDKKFFTFETITKYCACMLMTVKREAIDNTSAELSILHAQIPNLYQACTIYAIRTKATVINFKR